MDDPKPWERESSLEENRLLALAGLIMLISDECTDLHDEEAGDGAFSLGCRIYQRICTRLLRLSASGEWPWLRVRSIRNELEIALMVGSCLLRYYRGDPKNPTNRQLARAEEIQMHLFRKSVNDTEAAFNWFIVLEKGAAGTARRVVIQQANSDGEIRYPWIIAHADSRTRNGTVTPIGRPAVKLDPVIITSKTSDQTNEDQNENK